jgi:hypothetical protein
MGTLHKTASSIPASREPDLIEWLASDSEEEREVIIEARLPRRTLPPKQRSTGVSSTPRKSATAQERAEVLAELDSFLARQLSSPRVMLRAAGAIALRTTGRQAHRLLGHPLIKAIRFNRRLPSLPPAQQRSAL